MLWASACCSSTEPMLSEGSTAVPDALAGQRQSEPATAGSDVERRLVGLDLQEQPVYQRIIGTRGV